MPGKWTKFKQPVGFNASTMLLLTDATVLVHDAGAAANGTVTPKPRSPPRLEQASGAVR